MAKTKSSDGRKAAPEVTDMRELSLQARAKPGEISSSLATTFWFTSTGEEEVANWWSPQRDRDLRDFWMKPGNDILAGAVSSMVKKFRAMNWVLEGPKSPDPEKPQPGTVDFYHPVLAEAEYGQGWTDLLGKAIQDYLTQDKGMLIELIGDGEVNGPLQGAVKGLAHLDAGLCQLTGDPIYPVLFSNPKQDNLHRIHATRLAHASDLTSPRESMSGVGFCAVSRVISASNVLLKLAQYKNEKLSDLPQAGLLLLNNIMPAQWEDVNAEHQRERRRLNQELWANIMVLMGLDPERPVTADFLNFASLPDAFDERSATDIYVNIVALAFGVDTREFWPMSAGPLGTAAETLVQHQKARGKGVGDVISTIERLINWKVLPASISFRFDFRDDEEDLQRAKIISQKTETIMHMWRPRETKSGVETPISREELRRMLADNVPYFREDFLEAEQDVTEETEVTDTDRRGYPLVMMDSKGFVRPLVRGAKRRRLEKRFNSVVAVVEDNLRAGKITAEDAAYFALDELLDRRTA